MRTFPATRRVSLGWCLRRAIAAALLLGTPPQLGETGAKFGTCQICACSEATLEDDGQQPKAYVLQTFYAVTGI
ncbi:hypothetical protein PF010_g30046, partial [Phytophthora fragariae]